MGTLKPFRTCSIVKGARCMMTDIHSPRRWVGEQSHVSTRLSDAMFRCHSLTENVSPDVRRRHEVRPHAVPPISSLEVLHCPFAKVQAEEASSRFVELLWTALDH